MEPLIIRGKVTKGTSTGKKIDFPTINIPYTGNDLEFGVYACKVKISSGVYKGALHFGPRKVLNLDEPILEVHLLNFSADLYGKEVEVQIFKKIRSTKDFTDLDSLKKQIALDVEEVKRFLSMNN